MSLKHEIDKIKGVGTDHAKLARDYYLNIVKWKGLKQNKLIIMDKQ